MVFPQPTNRPLLTYILLIANAAMFGLATLMGGSENPQVLLRFGAQFGPLIAAGEYWRLFTAMFMHSGVMHIALNGFGLLIFGSMVEQSFGHVRFFIIYILSGLAGGVSSYIFNPVSIGVGASGAIFGVIGALAAYFVVQRKTFGQAARNNLAGIGLLVAINIAIGLSTPGIDNWAHMGGLIAGFFLGLVLSPSYYLSRPVFGYSIFKNTPASLAVRWWVVPLMALILASGVSLANVRWMENPLTKMARAERLYEQGSVHAAYDELSPVVALNLRIGAAHLLMGKIYMQQGDYLNARNEFGSAVKYSRGETRQEATALLVRVRREHSLR